MTKGEKDDLRAKYLKHWEGTSRFMLGDEAAALGAIYAGCHFFGGYPITPASEVAEVISRAMPKVDGYYIQMEDEYKESMPSVKHCLGNLIERLCILISHYLHLG